ncbi:hypothetical protein GF325_01310 [Candidatus Bathyarchaeota archaeon]|nr:hypothetical protein [Candidatus Bathyarchaeota archaeon]
MTSRSKRKEIITRSLLLALFTIPLPLFYGIYLTRYKGTPVPDTAWISWYDDPRHEVYVAWETNANTTGTVHFGTDPLNLVNSSVESMAVKFHVVNLTGLAPDTKYYYRIDQDGTTYTTGEFRTAPASQPEFTFGLFADTQQKVGPGWHGHTAKEIANRNYSFVAMVGDFVEDGEKFEWNDFFTKASTYLDTIPIVPVRGNHDKPRDLDDDGIDEYYFGNYFPQTVDSISGLNPHDTGEQFYFSFNWSSVHVQVLHFPEIDIDDFGEPGGLNPGDYNRSFTADQLAWLEADLTNAAAMPFRITLFHCPITGAGFYGPNYVLKEELLPILQSYNVTAVVSGHAHHYERGTLVNQTFPENPLTYFVVGCGGGLTDIGLRPVPETDVALASPCFTEVTANATYLEFTTYGFEGTVLDKFSVGA